MSDNRLQEIITTAVVGRAERQLTFTHTMEANGIQNVLGMRVGKTEAQVSQSGEELVVNLSVECDLWCDDGTSTRVAHTKATSAQNVSVQTNGQEIGERQVSLTVQNARLQSVGIEGDQVTVVLAVGVTIQISAESRLWVRAYDLAPAFFLAEATDASGSGSGSGSSDASGDDSGDESGSGSEEE